MIAERKHALVSIRVDDYFRSLFFLSTLSDVIFNTCIQNKECGFWRSKLPSHDDWLCFLKKKGAETILKCSFREKALGKKIHPPLMVISHTFAISSVVI